MTGWEWLSQLMQVFADLIPRPLIVRTDERCVEFVIGAYPRVLQPGWYIEWPLLARYEVVQVRRQVTARAQRFDRHAYHWKVVYEVEDALKLVTNTYDFDVTIADFTEIAFSNVYRKIKHRPNATSESPDMFCQQVRKRVLASVRAELEPYGIHVLDFAVASQATAYFSVSIWELKANDEQ